MKELENFELRKNILKLENNNSELTSRITTQDLI
jgi:hypothetical protein